MYPGFQMGMTWMTVTSIIWMALAVLVLVAMAWLVVVFARTETRRRVLDDLFARGFIDKDEYGHWLEALRTG